MLLKDDKVVVFIILTLGSSYLDEPLYTLPPWVVKANLYPAVFKASIPVSLYCANG